MHGRAGFGAPDVVDVVDVAKSGASSSLPPLTVPLLFLAEGTNKEDGREFASSSPSNGSIRANSGAEGPAFCVITGAFCVITGAFASSTGGRRCTVMYRPPFFRSEWREVSRQW